MHCRLAQESWTYYMYDTMNSNVTQKLAVFKLRKTRSVQVSRGPSRGPFAMSFTPHQSGSKIKKHKDLFKNYF